jgi:hypothetical protein
LELVARGARHSAQDAHDDESRVISFTSPYPPIPDPFSSIVRRPEKAWVAGSFPSLATTFSITYKQPINCASESVHSDALDVADSTMN